jgi:hypothetical protein
MIANLIDIQKYYIEMPDTWVVEGITTDTYSQSTDHFSHGWRQVVIPEITEYQRLGDEFVLVGDIVTKEVIDFTVAEIHALNLQKAIQIDLEYKDKITKLLNIPMQKVICEELEAIPSDILAEKERLKTECNEKIIALGISDFSFRKKVTLTNKL